MSETIKMNCPVCQEPVSRQIDLVIDGGTDFKNKQAIMKGEFFAFECDNCGAKRLIETHFIYYDSQKKILFFLMPNLGADPQADQRLLNQAATMTGQDLSDYKLRVVQSGPDLVEKIQIYERGYDDQVMELVKMLTDGLFAKNQPNRQVQQRFFYAPAGQEAKFMYLTDQEQFLVDFHESLVSFIQDNFKKYLADDPKGEFRLVNQAWANKVLEDYDS